MRITTHLKQGLYSAALLGSASVLANPTFYVEPPSIENVMGASSYVSYMYRTEALRNHWIGHPDRFFLRLSSIDTFGETRSALIATLLNQSYSIEHITTHCQTKETTIKTKMVYDATGRKIESTNQPTQLGRPIPDSKIAEAILAICDALAIIPANPNVHADKMEASIPFMKVINEHVRAQGTVPRAITVDNIDGYFKTQLTSKK